MDETAVAIGVRGLLRDAAAFTGDEGCGQCTAFSGKRRLDAPSDVLAQIFDRGSDAQRQIGFGQVCERHFLRWFQCKTHGADALVICGACKVVAAGKCRRGGRRQRRGHLQRITRLDVACRRHDANARALRPAIRFHVCNRHQPECQPFAAPCVRFAPLEDAGDLDGAQRALEHRCGHTFGAHFCNGKARAGHDERHCEEAQVALRTGQPGEHQTGDQRKQGCGAGGFHAEREICPDAQTE